MTYYLVLLFALLLGAAFIYGAREIRKESAVVWFVFSFYGAALICSAVYSLILKIQYL